MIQEANNLSVSAQHGCVYAWAHPDTSTRYIGSAGAVHETSDLSMLTAG
jgi:hypothetical protein